MLERDGDIEYDRTLIGYVRVSTEEQNYDLQRQAMLDAKVHPKLIFEDIESGWAANKERPGLREALRFLLKGSTLLVWKLDRLGRNTAELILTVHRLHERGVNFRSLTQSEINTQGMQTATGKLIFHLFCALAQFESDQVSERTKAGMRARAIG
jgi:DNA invertase Pin-like site-specific DNA recombinase